MEEKKPLKRKPRGRKIKRVEKKNKKVPIKEERIGLKIGYMRVSTKKQDHQLQYDALVIAGVKPEHIFQDTISGSKISREGRDACLKSLLPGDVLCVWKLDRFSRSAADAISQMQKLQEKNIGFVSITENIDTTTPFGVAIMQIIAVLAQLERENIRERVKAGIKAKRDSGEIKSWGRKPMVDYDVTEILKLMKKMSVRQVSKQTGVPKSTVYAISKRNKKVKP